MAYIYSFGFFIPLAIIFLSYYKIGKTLKHQTRATNTRLSKKTNTNTRLSKKTKPKTKSYYKIGKTLKHQTRATNTRPLLKIRLEDPSNGLSAN